MSFIWAAFVLLVATFGRTESEGMNQFVNFKSINSTYIGKLLKQRFDWKYFIEVLQQYEKSLFKLKVDPCLLSFVQIDSEELLKGK